MSSSGSARRDTAHPGGTPDPDGPEPLMPSARAGEPTLAAGTATPAAEDWRPIADRIARHGQDFLDGVTAVASGESRDRPPSPLPPPTPPIPLAPHPPPAH